MKTTKILAILVLALWLMVCPAELAGAEPMGTAFTYQGRLVDDNSVANGLYDFQFRAFDNPIFGNQQGHTIYINELNVIDGNFTVELDFGSGIFYGDARWLEIGVRPGGSTDSFTILSPLQEIKPTPNSIHATHALQADEADTLNGFDSTAFASIAHSHDGVYALISHTHSGSDITTGTVADGLIAASIARDSEITWKNLAGIPAGFADDIDDIGGPDSDWTISGNDIYSGVAGNVGIGTSSPLSKLSVGGNGISSTGVYGGGTDFGLWGSGSSVGVWGEDSDNGSHGRLGFATYGVYGSGSSAGVYGINSDSGSYGRLGYGAYGGYFSGDGYFSGNVGIGTTTPDRTLEISGILRVAREADNAHGADFSYVVDEPVTGHDGLIIDSDTGGGWSDIHLRTIGTTKLFVESGGNVGIGTTNPLSKLSVGGDGLADTGVYGKGIDFGVYGKGDAVGVNGNGSNYGVCGDGGSVGVNGWGNDFGVSGSSGKTGVRGSGDYGVMGLGLSYDFYATGVGVDYGSSSSIRWKNNIRPIDSPLEKVMNLRGVYYNWDAEHGGSHDLGMIAEEVGEVLPEIVQYEENGIDAEGMDYSKLTPLLVEAVKSLKIQADERQKQLAEKDVEIAGLKDRLSKLENVVAKLDRMQKGGR